MRHPRVCRNFAEFRHCKFVRCAYTHSQDSGDNNYINELKKEVDELKQHVKSLSESCSSENESKIKTLEDEVNVLKLEVKKLIEMQKKVSRDVPNVKLPELVNARSNITANTKSKCDLCDASFKKRITLEKHKNTKHKHSYSSSNKKLGEGQFGFAFDVRPGKEADAEALRLEWREQKNTVNNINEKENNVGNDKVTNLYNEKRKYDENKKESEVVDVKDYFQLEFVDGEPLFVCHICNEGLDTEAEITKHIEDNHESIMNDDSYDDTELYEGFDEEGHRIVESNNL